MTIIDWTGRYENNWWVVSAKSRADYVSLGGVPVPKGSKDEPLPSWTAEATVHFRPEHIPALATAIRLLRQMAAKEASAKRQEPEAVGA